MKRLSSEWLKTKRTAIRWLTFCMPVLSSAFLLWYIGQRGIHDNEQVLTACDLFLEVWTTFVIPLGAGLLPGLLIRQEELAGDFTGFFRTRAPRYRLFTGKFVFLYGLSAVSTLIAAITFGIGLDRFPGVSVPWPVFIMSVLSILVGMIPILILQLWASFAWGMGASIGISIGGLLMAALIGATSLGNKIWQFIPWAWPVRLAKLTVRHLVSAPGGIQPTEGIPPDFVMSQLTTGLAAVTVCSILAFAGGVLWFNRWEGRKTYE